MIDDFVSRRLLIKVGKFFHETSIIIEKPFIADDGHYITNIQFSNVKKYNAKIKGSDSLNSLECSLSYVNKICKESDDPEFFWEQGEKF